MAATTTFWSPGRAEPALGGPARGPLIIAAAAAAPPPPRAIW